ncbi:Ada metal-binding domain-containing protein [Xylophilus sp. GOD-11R]|uniref:Ada metal-binding domain-containing protein n=1 Tax=Xylophilus sp. GOD-11R TaxID=3089814 RepID=UPI00298C2FF7|nr:Ada metal-binding domain-containing protein [Xylophilus sp. GOD-11R]WPB58484.1 Ada metal-binding domain-containing protein [Xylophilus sp. GOD-11R]
MDSASSTAATTALPTDTEGCWRALASHDARFDGRFFTGVTSTGIYCRPVCRVRTPRLENCRFFALAAQAEQAGFRPCLRCRPELAPSPGGAAAWSMQDAGSLLAHAAAAWLDDPLNWSDEAGAALQARLADHLGVTDRHLRRVFLAAFGVTALQYLQTRRLLSAKQLLTDTRLPVSTVAQAAGFASQRRFNAAFLEHYRLSPTALRREGSSATDTGTATIRLPWRAPYDAAGIMAFFGKRAVTGLETLVADEQVAGRSWLTRTLALGNARGWLQITLDTNAHQALLRVGERLAPALPALIRRVRAMLDLDADPAAIDAVLLPHFPGSAGGRVPGALDGFELAVRAILGQQVTVAAAHTICGRLVVRYGEPIETPFPGVDRLFPTPAALALADGDVLGGLGIVRQRQAAIVALAREVDAGRLALRPGDAPEPAMAALRALPGIGDWTAQYIAMRALRWPDAFPAGDVALQKALGVRGAAKPAQAAIDASQAWRPWRSYAVLRAWHGTPEATISTPAEQETTP